MALTELPRYEQSIAALEWIGLTTKAATTVCQNSAGAGLPPQDGPYLDFVDGHIQGIDSQLRHDEPNISDRERMSRIGIRPDIIDAILNPKHKAIFMTETLVHWMKDTMRINDLTLAMLTERPPAAKTRGHPEERRPFNGLRRPLVAERGAFITATCNAKSQGDPSLPEKWVRYLCAPPAPRPNHVRLWKAMPAAEMQEWLADDDSGDIDVNVFPTYYGGDFNAGHAVCYWTRERETAEMYRAYMEERCPAAETWLMGADIPEQWLQSLTTKHLWYSADWKEFTWLCKTMRNLLPLPEHLEPYAGETDILEGHICGRHPDIAPRIPREDIQTRINDNHVLRLPNGSKATQFVIEKPKVAIEMAAQMRGKVHIEITPARRGRVRDAVHLEAGR